MSYIVTIAQSNNYNIQHFNSENGLAQNSVKAIEIDKKGYLWFATEMGLVRYDGSNFKNYDRTNSPELVTDRILNLGLLKDGNMFAQVDVNYYYYLGANGVLQRIPKSYQEKYISDYFTILEIYPIYNKCKLKYENGQIPKWALPDFALIKGSLFNSLVYINKHYYYFNENRDLIAADTNLTLFRKIDLKGQLSSLSGHTKGQKAESIALIARNNSLYVHWRDNIYKLSFLKEDQASGEIILWVGNIAHINCFLEIPQINTFVVGTNTNGCYIFQKQLFSVLTLKDDKSNVFYAQAPYGYDGVLTDRGVLFPDKYIPLPTDDFTYESILRTNNGNYYLSRVQNEYESGVVELDSQLHELRYIRTPRMNVNCFRQLKDGSIWIAGNNDLIGRIESNQIRLMGFRKSLPEDFRVNTFIQLSNNELWIGSYKGLAKVNLTTGRTHLFTEFKDVEVRSLHEDKRGTIWIGTYGNGYYAFYKGRCIAMPMDDQHFLATAHTFMEDNSGYVWITTNRGLFQVLMADLYNYLNGKSKSLYYYYYYKTGGFLTNEFNGGCVPSGIKLNNGKFSLPSINGLVQFYPDSIKPILPGAQIYVDAIIGDTTVFNSNNKLLSISQNINLLQFSVSSPYFGNSYNQCLEYTLNKVGNSGDTWYKVSKNGSIQFNKLTAGNYHLLLRKKSGFGHNNYIMKEVAFSVTPFFYETWLFKILMLAVLMALVYSFFRLRIIFLTHQKAQLQVEVSKKTKEQERLIGNLETTVAELEKTQQELYQNNLLKEELALLVAHDLQSPLRFIHTTSDLLNKVLVKKDYNEAQAMSLELSRSSFTTYRFVEDFTLWLATLGKVFHPQNTGVNLHNLFMELSRFFTELLTINKNKLQITIDKSLMVYTDSQLLTMILRNIIDNANKHTRGGIIQLTGKVDNSFACIIISDNGEGIKEEVLKKIQFQIKYGSNKIDKPWKLNGNGYRFITHFCNLLDIHVEVESKFSEGTTARLTNLKM